MLLGSTRAHRNGLEDLERLLTDPHKGQTPGLLVASSGNTSSHPRGSTKAMGRKMGWDALRPLEPFLH